MWQSPAILLQQAISACVMVEVGKHASAGVAVQIKATPFQMRELVLRMYWDGETEPSVEVPVGDFFGTGFEYEDVPGAHRGQKYQSWWSLPITVQDRALNCYFEMPFGNGGRVTLTNDGVPDVPNLYFHIDYQEFSDARGMSNKGRFHAQWRRQVTRAFPESESGGKNVDGKNNHVFMEATGKGQFVGKNLTVFGLSTGWWGEGDDMFFVMEKPPAQPSTEPEWRTTSTTRGCSRKNSTIRLSAIPSRGIGTGQGAIPCTVSISRTPSIFGSLSARRWNMVTPTT